MDDKPKNGWWMLKLSGEAFFIVGCIITIVLSTILFINGIQSDSLVRIATTVVLFIIVSHIGVGISYAISLSIYGIGECCPQKRTANKTNILFCECGWKLKALSTIILSSGFSITIGTAIGTIINSIIYNIEAFWGLNVVVFVIVELVVGLLVTFLGWLVSYGIGEAAETNILLDALSKEKN